MWTQILEGKYDDMRPFISEEKLSWMDKFSDQLLNNIDTLASTITADIKTITASMTDPNSRKEFADFVKLKEKIYQPIYWDIKNGMDGCDSITQHILRNISSHFDVATKLGNNIKWADYKPNKKVNPN